MFAAFFYLLRQRGLHVSLNEWMTLLEGMEKGLHHSTLTGFYHLCRAIVVKNETEFDRFDQIFLEFFKNVPYTGELPEDLLDWLNHPSEDLKRTIADLRSAGFPNETLEELLKMLEERLKEQTEEHNGGNYWVGTQGRTPWGNNGWHPNGIRIGGQSMHRTAMMVAGERKFRDFRKDNKLDTRQFQIAFRTLRQLSAQERRPVYIVNGERYEGDAFREIPPAEIERMEQLPADEQTIERYGSDASNGVILITLKYDSKAVFTADSLSFDRYVARRIKWDATDPVARVVYRFKVQCDGSVVLTDLLESTDGRLRRKVVKAVEEAPRWSPATKDGRPVETEHVLRVQLPEGRAMPPERAVILL